MWLVESSSMVKAVPVIFLTVRKPSSIPSSQLSAHMPGVSPTHHLMLGLICTEISLTDARLQREYWIGSLENV